MSGAGVRASITPNTRKMIQNIKEIAGNHNEEEIYAMLTECSMDPDETAQRLLQDYMEDSGQRKRRLEEMRKQAELSEAADVIKASGSGMHSPLSNPLFETSTTMSAQDKSYSAPRFDFYTDPMAAFSSSKKKGNVQAAPDHTTPAFVGSPMGQFSSPRMPAPPCPDCLRMSTLLFPNYTQVQYSE